jgi:N-acetylneuraminic acid mutarotase
MLSWAEMKKKLTILAAVIVLLLLFPIFADAISSPEESWTTLAPMPTARRQFGVAVVDGKIFAIGGNDGNYQRYLDTNEMYDPTTNTWSEKARMPTPRIDFGIAVYENKIYVLGGAIGVDPSDNGNALITTANEVYDPFTDTWETKAPMPTPRHGLTASVANDKIYTVSGIEHVEGSYRGLDYGSVKNEVYDPKTNTWSTKPSIPNGVLHAVSVSVDDKIYVLGGAEVSIAIFGPANSNQVYDIKQEVWSLVSPIPNGVDAAAGAVVNGAFMSNRIFLFGGFLTSSNEPCNLTQIYNPKNDVWVSGSQMPTPHALFGVANVNDELYAIGGSSMREKSRFISNVNEKYLPSKITEDILVNSPQNIIYEGSSVALDFVINKPASWIGYSLDGKEITTILGNTTLSDLSVGSHNVTVYAKDVEGNVGSSETLFFSVAKPETFPTTTFAIVSGMILVLVVGIISLLLFRRHRKTAKPF